MPSTPHDLLFKSTFSVVEIAEGELRSVLPAELSAAIDWRTLKHEPGSFVDAELKEQHTDLLFSASLGGEPIRLYLLFEHQSTVDPEMPLRMLGYVQRNWSALWKNGARRLPLVIPIVLHHSESGWTAARSVGELIAIPEALGEAARVLVPELQIVLDDLGQVSEEKLLAREMAALAKLVVWTLRLVRLGYDPAFIVQWAREAHEASTQAPREAFRAWLRYLSEVDKATPALHALLAAETSESVSEVVMGLRHEWEKAAEERGRAEGEARGRAEGEARGRAETLLKLLKLRFGEVPADVTEQVRSASVADLDRWTERVLIASSLDLVFAE